MGIAFSVINIQQTLNMVKIYIIVDRLLPVFTAHCTLVHLRGLAIACRLSVRPSVRPSVRL